MHTVTRVQILDEADNISHRTNILGKSMNPFILPPTMEKENSEFKPVKLCFKFDLAFHPTCVEGLVNTYILKRLPFYFIRWIGFSYDLSPVNGSLCFTYAYVDIAFSRWDIATEVYRLVYHSSKKNKTRRALLEKQGRTHKRRSLMDACTWMCQCWPTSKDWLTLVLSGHKILHRRPARSDWW